MEGLTLSETKSHCNRDGTSIESTSQAHTGLTQEMNELTISGAFLRLEEKDDLSGLECWSSGNKPENVSTSRTLNEKDIQEYENPGRKSDSQITDNTWTCEEDFAEICLDDEWVKVEILKRDCPSKGIFSVRRLDSGKQFEVEIMKLARWGSHEKESL